jgi:hypothetical protein
MPHRPDPSAQHLTAKQAGGLIAAGQLGCGDIQPQQRPDLARISSECYDHPNPAYSRIIKSLIAALCGQFLFEVPSGPPEFRED